MKDKFAGLMAEGNPVRKRERTRFLHEFEAETIDDLKRIAKKVTAKTDLPVILSSAKHSLRFHDPYGQEQTALRRGSEGICGGHRRKRRRKRYSGSGDFQQSGYHAKLHSHRSGERIEETGGKIRGGGRRCGRRPERTGEEVFSCDERQNQKSGF